MRKKKIAICAVQVPFNYGGAEVLVEELNKQLRLRNFDSEIINIPFKWYPKERLINEAFIWSMMDLTESNGEKIDMVICTKYPSYIVKHPNKVVWLFHQHRSIYELLGTSYSEFSQTSDDLKIINHVRDIDNKFLSQANQLFAISQNVKDRLLKYNQIESEVLYPPTKHEGKYKSAESQDYIFRRVDLIR
ncbi:hypothetical protein OMP38_29590 [Cohnella ginsengisoli]|uniref:Glycosyltransferase n=1 Tax=Cohnella ginsengisoli TaxID=425004 RepID=A0A9X4KMD3_9BACL|nr:hypothetical protein [Cohnella ginsengisoli]MDG0794530.1 hypothetical protein [Cohnella ginsengisoli]